MRAKKFRVSNLTNETDITTIESSLSQLKGVNAVRVDVVADTVTVDFNENEIDEKQIQSQLNSLVNGLS
ncbi:cation transporter [Thermohalobacter berrensis]|uniref:HMA domain-containing protein n=1 Tax=Thermohalobacter berrensis TaxID=99594 RepID=A0A419T260_9FIRM|nr:cation transporter [Thermohalobacter berrensis]RKD31555.1 hypothetical protein BET03_12365 [Thermohalobacter berrensis]